GAMRQAGFLAAAGIYALDHHIDRLKEDHQRASLLADLLKSLSFVEEIIPPETNILIFKLKSGIAPRNFLSSLASRNILAAPFGGQTIRFVTHLDFNDEMLAEVKESLQNLEKEFTV
ncbi:MAG: threonine aldolase, partial [Bacteroidales bacterium]|nr:threonine aldolase [Bacteroidales bacterium]